MTFSIMLWMPSWGGLINLSGAWDKLRTDPVLRFMVVSLAFYGMANFEGPMMSVRQVNALSHYTDWGIGHVHSGAMGWVAFITFGGVLFLVGALIMAYNCWRTMRRELRVEEAPMPAPSLAPVPAE